MNVFSTVNWPKIVGETLIIVVGVFLGVQASNWNEERLEREETVQVLRSLKPELANFVEGTSGSETYYAVTRRYADTAFRGWRGDPAVSDREFVIAAYQASQITFTSISGQSWSTIFGADRLRTLKDDNLRTDLALMMSQDYAALEGELFTDYREHVRQVIPEDIQDAIRAKCGDQRYGNGGWVRLPSTCSLDLSDERFAVAARALRERPELVGELRWHLAAMASYVFNLQNLGAIAQRIRERIARA